MAISIYFESYFRHQPYENAFNPENYQEWTVKEKWSIFPHVIQEITLVNEDEFIENYYYVDLEIVSVYQECDEKILKSGRMASNDIKFLIKGNEFSCFPAHCGILDVNNENYTRDRTYRYKITLTPVLQPCPNIFPIPGKRTKIDILGCLKTLSNDIISMKGTLFSDITIYCGNKKVKAHRNILSARSTVFKKFLQGIGDEEVQSCLEIEPVIDKEDANSIKNDEVLPPIVEEDQLQNESESVEFDDASILSPDKNILKVRLKKIHSSIFHEFIDFIYSGLYKTSDINKTKDLLIAAQDYGICDLEENCIMYLKSQLSRKTSDDIYSFASVCKYEDLQTYVLDYMINNIIGRRRKNIHLLQLIEQQETDAENEEEKISLENIRWLKIIINHPTYFKDILTLKKGKKIKDVFSRFFPEACLNDDHIMADCKEHLESILDVCAANSGNAED